MFLGIQGFKGPDVVTLPISKPGRGASRLLLL